MKKLYNNYINIRVLLLALLAGFFALGVNAQSIDSISDAPAPGVYFLSDTTDASITYWTSGAFPSGTTFYLHTGMSGTNFDSEDVLTTSTSTGDSVVIDFSWDNGGANAYYLTAATGNFDSNTIDIGSSTVVAGGSYNNMSDMYEMNGTGLRRITTQSYDLSTSDQVVLMVWLDATNVDVDRPIRVQYSTDGTNFMNMSDADSADNQWSGGMFNLRFELSSGQKTSATSFRVLQDGKSDYVNNEEEWMLDASGMNFSIEIGGMEFIDDVFINNYTVISPTTTITDFNDDDENPLPPGGNYYAGQSIEIEGLFGGATDQADEFNYTAIFTNGDTRFLLESPAQSNSGNDISIEGTIPDDIAYGENWQVTIGVYTGSTPTLGTDENLLLGDVETVGYDMGMMEFNSDGDRWALTGPLDIQSNTNGFILLGLNRTSAGLSPDGTGVVLEYTTNGTTFTQIGDTVSLNADLSSNLEFDLSGTSGVISSSTQFRVRQISNNGLELDTWDIWSFSLYTGGSILADDEPVNYISSNVDINAPLIDLDPVDVPDDLLFPGDTVSLVYNITAGAFPTGTTIMAVLEGAVDYMVGTSSLITPGDSEDHTITITIPPVVGGNYDLSLFSSTGAESNQIFVPVYNTMMFIEEVSSDNGILDGGVDIIYPGDMITVDYTLVGSIGASAELFLEVLDNRDPGTTDDDEWVMLNSVTGSGVDGDITGTLPANINYDDPGNPTVRLRIGNGLLADNSLIFGEDALGMTLNMHTIDPSNITDVFVVDLIEGNDPDSEDHFIGSGERSAVTIPFEMPFGGTISLNFYEESYNEQPQTVSLQATNDGTTFMTIAEEDYDGNNFGFDGIELPESLWGNEVQFRFIYNGDEASGEFENEISINNITIQINEFVTANTQEYDFSGQFRRPAVSLETLESTDFVVGESIEIEYTTEGNFPANTSFAIVFEGTLNSGADFETVVGTNSATGQGTFGVTVPDFAFEDDGTDNGLNLYDDLRVVAYNATDGAAYMPNEEIPLNDDSQFLVIEGTDDSDGVYEFHQAGDRSLLTQAYDLSSASDVSVTFDFSDMGIAPTDNILTIPVFQASIDGGATFHNIPVEEDGLLGDGYMFNNTTYTADVPSTYITDATHFRWYQALNLGDSANTWGVNGIAIILENGNEITTYYERNNSPIMITVNHPDMSQYELNRTDGNDAVFNGEMVALSLDKTYETTRDFPTGTLFEYLLYHVDSSDYFMDPETDEPLIIASTNAIGAFNASIPFYITEGTHEIHLRATKEGSDGLYYYVGEPGVGSWVGDLDVFLRAVKATFTGDPNAVVYAGSTVAFDIDVENDETNGASTDSLYANLVLWDGTDDWLLAVQRGTSDSISANLPPFVTGNRSFRVELTENAPLGTVGEAIDNDELENLENDEGNFISGDVMVGSYVEFPNSSGRSFITTRDFEVGELENANLLSFNLYLDQVPEDLTSDQYVIFEYSIDGGATYTQLASYPDPSAETTTNEEFRYEVTDAMKMNATRFRWRQEERKGSVIIWNVSFVFEEALPFDVIGDYVDISQQALLITSLGGEQACNGDSVTINYEIRGRFGADNVVRVEYSNGSKGTIDGYEFNLIEGTGSIMVQLPVDVLSDNSDNDWFKFNLMADDDTYDGNNFMVNGPLSEQSLEYVAPINIDNMFFVSDPLACESEETIVTVNSPQNYFMYQVRNAANGTVLGSLSYDPEVMDSTLSIGVLTQTTGLELAITAMTSSGTTCNTLVSTHTDTVEVLANYDLYLRNDNVLYDTYLPVSTGDTVTFCEGSGDIFLRAIRVLENGTQSTANPANVEWFRNDVNTPVDANDATLASSTSGEMPESGWYFARIRQESCTYLTTSIYLNIIPQLDRPTITVVSGDLDACEGADPVVLQGPVGYNYYRWNTPGGILTARTIEADISGSYTVQVSNEPFDTSGSCGSPLSPAVVVTRDTLPQDIQIATTDNLNSGSMIVAGDTLTACEGGVTVYFFDEGVNTASGGTIEIYKDGVMEGFTTSSSITIDESGEYYLLWRNEDLNASCTVSSVTFYVEITQVPDPPVITYTGDLSFCVGGSNVVTLTTASGYAHYIWYRNGTEITSTQDGFNTGSNTLQVTEGGTYTVQVGNAINCYSFLSNDIVVNSRALPSIPTTSSSYFNQVRASCGEGFVTFQLDPHITIGSDNLYSYQLINAVTGMPSGNPVVGNDSDPIYITSGSISEPTQFYFEVSYADGSGCVNSDPARTFWGENNNVVLEMVGNTITANYSDFSGRIETRWYRNGVELVNRRNSSSIMVADAATYSIEVDFNGGCTITSNSVSVGASTISGFTGDFRFSAHPNPAVNTTTVRMNGQTGNFNFSITNSEGRIVSSGGFTIDDSTDEESFLIDMSSLRTGIYVIRVTGEHGTHSERIVKQ